MKRHPKKKSKTIHARTARKRAPKAPPAPKRAPPVTPPPPAPPPFGVSMPVADFRRCVRAIAPFASTDETRLHIASVLFRFDEKSTLDVVATDGHAMARWRQSALGVPGSVMVPGEVMLRLAAALKGRTFDEGLVTISDGAIELPSAVHKFKANKAQFPPYEMVIPKVGASPTRGRVAMSSALYTRAAKAFADATATQMQPGSVALYTEVRGELDAVVFSCPHAPELVVVAMPMRSGAGALRYDPKAVVL